MPNLSPADQHRLNLAMVIKDVTDRQYLGEIFLVCNDVFTRDSAVTIWTHHRMLPWRPVTRLIDE